MEAAGKLPQNGVAGLTSKTNQPGVLATDAAAVEHWCEIGRPQVHGHDFSCLAFLPHGTLAASYAYACGSEEKVVRVMEAPRVFLDTLDSLQPLAGPLHPAATPATKEAAGEAGGSPQGPGSGPWAGQAGVPGRRARGYGASVSALGLTNKAMEQGEGQGDSALGAGSGLQLPGVGAGGYEDGPDFAPHAAPCAVSTPPLEEHLAQNTLWPEGHKLYGHGDLVYCAAASPDGALLASACVAKASPRAAAVWVWDVAGDTWRGVAQLEAHTLTVTQLAWSHSGRWLASCSRDRSWAVHQRRSCAESASGPAPHSFRLVHRQKAAHARIIWGCAWSNDDRMLATGARDGLIKIWDTAPLAAAADDSSLCADWTTPCELPPKLPNAPLLTLPPFPSAVTALAFMPGAASPHVLAVGLEDGALQLWSIPSQSSVEGPARCLWRSDPLNGHAAQVSSVAWRDCGDCCQLATGSHDHSVRVFTVSLQ
ncbi:WD40-repeat-containing domain protein [Haematococcus lacustris]